MARFFIGVDCDGNAFHLVTQNDSPREYRLPALLKSPGGEVLAPGNLVAVEPVPVWSEDLVGCWSLAPGRTHQEKQAAKSFCTWFEEIIESSLDL